MDRPSVRYSAMRMLSIGKLMMILIITSWIILQGICISSGSRTKNGNTKVNQIKKIKPYFNYYMYIKNSNMNGQKYISQL